MSPMREAWITGTATLLGAVIPVAPFFFTGRGVFRSGLDMFLVGLGVAVVGYLVGEWIVKLL